MREQRLTDFLNQNALGTVMREPLAGDASSRRYERIRYAGQSLILMDAPPPEKVVPFVKVAGILKACGYSPPEIIAADMDNGFLLLEDLGDGLFARLLEAGSAELPFYKLATDFLIDLTRQLTSDDLPHFSDDYIAAQNDMFLDWYIPEKTNTDVSVEERKIYSCIWERLMPKIRVGPEVLLLRDFHAENLLHLKGRPGLKALGLLDFQDALIGPSAYDLVSLLQDARRDVSTQTAEQMIAHYIEKTGVDAGFFRRSYAILGAHRALRIMGIFVRLAKSQGKKRYLEMLPRMRSHLVQNLEHPVHGELKEWLKMKIGDAGQ